MWISGGLSERDRSVMHFHVETSYAREALMAGLLYEVSPLDVATLATVVVLLAAATLVANWLPARRAARVEPLTALRAE